MTQTKGKGIFKNKVELPLTPVNLIYHADIILNTPTSPRQPPLSFPYWYSPLKKMAE